jgi:hypothetical protein
LRLINHTMFAMYCSSKATNIGEHLCKQQATNNNPES